MMAQNEPHSDARTVLVSDAEDFHHETQFIETLRLILREDHTRIVDDTLYEKVLDWMLRCVTLDPVNRIRARDGYQLSPKFPSDFAGHEEILRMIGSGLQQKESRVVAVMLKLCGHLCSLGDAAFKMVHDGPLDALNIALRLTNHAEPRIRTAAYECLTLAASFAGHHADSATPRNNKHTPDATQCRTTQVDVNAHESARRSVEWCAHEEESLFECVAASLSDRSIYVQLQGRTLLVNVLNACQDTPRLLAKIWQDGSPMYDEITRVLDDAPAFSYERKKAIADMVLAVCLAVQDSVPLDLGSDAQR
ncbi:hypothetical protein SARC_02190 [Sphaeroforma arctica JP610]|uniref:Uncharacterized protein n=1 Tax=Sphaeroforma arctica JP610 TaxID=667725 RepID=A0A0L0G9C7_9EUKA|nr:hypothetical protein SARC_02190 [Sphaeroforma arctica JP610]KNC85617.1 hypothetical protein SARC_02190 [Sphaeroforma arctica JP610]|eukprot:XP_014159519.1 hypothetical protein SARC_02190 [Sphaeroforma arctica JP610]